MKLKVIIVGCFLILASIVLYFFGQSIINEYLSPRDPLSGSYVIIFSVFLGIGGFLILVSQVFPSKSILT